MYSETNLKVRSVVPDIALYLGDRLDRLSTFHGSFVIIFILFSLFESLCRWLLINLSSMLDACDWLTAD